MDRSDNKVHKMHSQVRFSHTCESGASAVRGTVDRYRRQSAVSMDYTKIILCRNPSYTCGLLVGTVACDTGYAGLQHSIALNPAAMAYALESTALSLKNCPASA